ncbi:glycosyltransferase family 4 protein [Rhodococcus ruber]|uniref:glycosyltransferase family 4 protein n=1 Tax=Rhodococcus ruber TaxID=1830 RepID=UPI003D818A6F
MKVLFDGYWWISGPPSGKMVLNETVNAWANQYPEDELTLVVPHGDKREAQSSVPPGVRLETSRLRFHPAINVIEIPRIRRNLGDIDAILTQNFATPSSQSFVYVHDAIFQSNPEWFTRAERAYLASIPVLARLARGVVTSTSTERARIQKYNPHLTNIAVSGLAVSTRLLSAASSRGNRGLREKRFLLSVGRLNIRKNIRTLIDAALEADVLSPEYPLVVVGESAGKLPKLPPQVDDAVRNGSILFLGHVEDGELRWLYENCDALVYISLAEGYGLPPVEARELGTEVIVSDLPVFRETIGTEGTFVDPTDAVEIGRALRNVKQGQRRSTAVTLTSWRRVVENIRSLVGSTQEVGRRR